MSSDAVSNVRDQLITAGLGGDIRTFPEPVPTAAAAAAALGCDVGAIANSLVFETDGAPLLVLASGAHRVHTARLAQRLGTGKIRRASPEFVLSRTGQEIGGVAPIGHPQPLRTIVDRALKPHKVLWAGGGDHWTMFAISYDDLIQVTDGMPCDVD